MMHVTLQDLPEVRAFDYRDRVDVIVRNGARIHSVHESLLPESAAECCESALLAGFSVWIEESEQDLHAHDFEDGQFDRQA